MLSVTLSRWAHRCLLVHCKRNAYTLDLCNAKGLATTCSLERISLPHTAQATGQSSHCSLQNTGLCLKVLSAIAIYIKMNPSQKSIGTLGLICVMRKCLFWCQSDTASLEVKWQFHVHASFLWSGSRRLAWGSSPCFLCKNAICNRLN